MDIARLYLSIGIVLALFTAAACLAFENPSLQWPGMDAEIWPASLVLWAIATPATALYFLSPIKRRVAASTHRISFVVGFFFVAGYSLTGICVLVLLPFRMASGI
jgi:membrane protease YdiL (CAAX protease family)